MLFLWKKSYEIGVAEIDMQHRRLVGMINELSDAMMERRGQRAVKHVLDELKDFIVEHFETEESVMEKSGYPDLPQHRIKHVELTRQVLEFREKARGDQQLEAIELLDFLCDWLRNHMMVFDKEVGKYLKDFNRG